MHLRRPRVSNSDSPAGCKLGRSAAATAATAAVVALPLPPLSSFPLLSPLPPLCFPPSLLPSSTFPSSFSSSSPSCSSSSSFLLSLPPSICFSCMLHPYIKLWAFLLCFFLLLMLWTLPNEFSSRSCHASWLLSSPVWRQQPVLTTLNDLFF